MELITLPEDGGGGTLDDHVRALFQLQAHALKAAHARIDALEQQQADKGHRAVPPFPTPPAHNPAREATVAAIAQLDAKTKKEVEQDEPAVTYDRVRNAVIALAVIYCLLVAIAAFTGRFHGKAYQVGRLFFSLADTGQHILFFGTLDSSAMAATAARTYRAFWIVLGVLVTVVYALDGRYAEAAFQLIFFWFGCAYYFTWLSSTMRERMRTRFKGKLAERAQVYTSRILQIAGLQTALLVQGLAQGIGPHSFGRNTAIFTFSCALIVAWIFSAGVFDAGEADPQRATRLRLSFRESAALLASMLYVLTGLAGYVMAEQGDPDADTAILLTLFSFVCLLVAAVLVARLVKIAEKKEELRSYYRARDANTASAITRAAANPAVALAV